MFGFLKKRKKKNGGDDDNIILLIKTSVKDDTIVLEKVREMTRDANFVDPKINSPYDIIAYAHWDSEEKEEKENIIKNILGVKTTESRLLVKIEDDN